MSLFAHRKKNRACVIGLDGVPYAMLARLAANGVMPAVARLLERGTLHRMKASLPEISAVSWTNFMTGTNSGTHGIFGFVDFKPGSYDIRFPNFQDVHVPTIWDTLGARGRKSIVINQPSTYPARKVEGILVSGFVAVDPAKAVYPAPYKAVLDKLGYRIDIDTMRSRSDHAYFLQDLAETTAGREKALDFFRKEPWDYFEFIITGTDRLHHYLWPAYEDASHSDHGKFLDYYRRVDGMIGKIAEAFAAETGGVDGLYMLSDHGFTGIVQEVYLNAWLERNGYLKYATPEPGGLDDIASGTRAFALDPNRIYLNLKPRFPRGEVEPVDKKGLLAEIAAGLDGLEYEGRKVVRRVFRAEEVYSGPRTLMGPDLLVLGEPGFDMKGSVKKKTVFGRTDLEGMHTWDDAFFWAARDAGKDLHIEHLARIILKNFS